LPTARAASFGSGDDSACVVSLLGRRWQLEDIDDVERFCATLAGDVGANLSWHERDDLLAHLLTTTWELHTRWDRERSPSFCQYARYVLRLRIVDHVRKERGRTRWSWSDHTYTREQPTLVSLELPIGNSPSGERVRLGDTLGEVDGDPADSRSPALARLLGGGANQRARDLETLGLDAARRVA
jgi:hypothetical protein